MRDLSESLIGSIMVALPGSQRDRPQLSPLGSPWSVLPALAFFARPAFILWAYQQHGSVDHPRGCLVDDGDVVDPELSRGLHGRREPAILSDRDLLNGLAVNSNFNGAAGAVASPSELDGLTRRHGVGSGDMPRDHFEVWFAGRRRLRAPDATLFGFRLIGRLSLRVPFGEVHHQRRVGEYQSGQRSARAHRDAGELTGTTRCRGVLL